MTHLAAGAGPCLAGIRTATVARTAGGRRLIAVAGGVVVAVSVACGPGPDGTPSAGTPAPATPVAVAIAPTPGIPVSAAPPATHDFAPYLMVGPTMTVLGALDLEQAARTNDGPAIVTLRPQSRVLTRFADRWPATAADVEEAAKRGMTITLGQEIGPAGISNVIVQVEIEWLLTGERESAELVLFMGDPGPSNAIAPKVDEYYVMFLEEGGIAGLYSYDPLFFEYDPAAPAIGPASTDSHPIGLEFAGRPLDELRAAAANYQWGR